MKTSPRVEATSYVSYQLSDLIEHINTELEFAIPCYEEGTLSPRRSFQYIREKLEELRELTKGMQPYSYDILKGSSNTLPPPATPEAL